VEVGSHLLAERVWQARVVRRRTYQAVLAFDVFMTQLLGGMPEFATFFTNHVASAMHRFWAAAFPGDYNRFGFDDVWVKRYGTEIDWAMCKTDEMLGRLIRFARRHRDYQVWVVSSMGQAATVAEPVETQLYVTDMAAFMRALGLERGSWQQHAAMLPRYTFSVAGEVVDRVRESLQQLRVAGRPVEFGEASKGFFTICLGHADLKEAGATVAGRFISFAQMGLAKVKIEDQSGMTAYHIPQGCLLIYDAERAAPRAGGTQISTLKIAPTLLRNFAVPIPGYMHVPLSLNAGNDPALPGRPQLGTRLRRQGDRFASATSPAFSH
jgi:hypothetical protein